MRIPVFAGTMVMLVSCCLAQERQSRPFIIGAIRWDAWTGGEITAQVERTLGPQKYQSRLPWFAEVKGDSQAHIDGSAQ